MEWSDTYVHDHGGHRGGVGGSLQYEEEYGFEREIILSEAKYQDRNCFEEGDL